MRKYFKKIEYFFYENKIFFKKKILFFQIFDKNKL